MEKVWKVKYYTRKETGQLVCIARRHSADYFIMGPVPPNYALEPLSVEDIPAHMRAKTDPIIACLRLMGCSEALKMASRAGLLYDQDSGRPIKLVSRKKNEATC